MRHRDRSAASSFVPDSLPPLDCDAYAYSLKGLRASHLYTSHKAPPGGDLLLDTLAPTSDWPAMKYPTLKYTSEEEK